MQNADYIAALGPLALASRLKRLSDRFMSEVARVYKASDVDFDPRCFPLFHLLSTSPGLTLQEAANRLQQSHAAISQTVTMLKKKELVSIAPSAQDERCKLLTLSPKGKALLPKLTELWQVLRITVERLQQEADTDMVAAAGAFERVLQSQDLFGDAIASLTDVVDIRRYRPEDARAFYDLNRAWVEKYFFMEPEDEKLLGNPDETIIAGGGMIFMAVDRQTGRTIGTCALYRHEDGSFELAKMAVTEGCQGKGIGRKLAEAVIAGARSLGAAEVFIISNTKLESAIGLYKRLGFIECPVAGEYRYERCNIMLRLDLSQAMAA